MQGVRKGEVFDEIWLQNLNDTMRWKMPLIRLINGLGCKGPQCSSSSNPLLPMCRVANQQPRLPRTTSSLALNACRDGASTVSLGNLF